MIRQFVIGVFAVALVSASTSARASTLFVTSTNDIRNDGLLDWSVLGDSGTEVPNTFSTNVPGITGLNITGSQDAGFSFERWDEGSDGWNGNFAPGDHLLFTGANPTPEIPGSGPMSFFFNSGVTGFGTHIQSEFFGPFRAELAVYDAADILLGRFFTDAVASDKPNAAPFIGVLSDAADIWHVTLNVISAQNQANDRLESFSIDSPRIQGELASTPAPEPASMVLLGTGLVAALRTARRRRAA